jgi:hypothetical protein
LWKKVKYQLSLVEKMEEEMEDIKNLEEDLEEDLKEDLEEEDLEDIDDDPPYLTSKVFCFACGRFIAEDAMFGVGVMMAMKEDGGINYFCDFCYEAMK